MVSVFGLLALAAWAAQGASTHPRALVVGGFFLWLLAGVAAWWFWSSLPAGVLAWDGAVWEFVPAGAKGERGSLAVHLDLQRRLCVRLHPVGARYRWIWLERHRAPHRWSDLRRAVYSRPGKDAADGAISAQPPAGTL